MSRINGAGGSPEPRLTQVNSEPVRRPATAAPKAPVTQAKSGTGDGFGPATARTAATSTPPRAAAVALPAAIPTGTPDFYKKRYADFVARNPGQTPPSYYLEYGQKYCDKFSSLTSKDLSPAGLAWRDKTLKNLQDAIEKKRAEDPVGFAQLERDPAAFKSFAFGTHPDAYIKGGLFDLPAQDLIKIGTTPELKDLIGPDGIKQVLNVASQMRPGDIGRIALDTVKEELRKHPITLPSLPHISIPHIPLPHLPFGL